MPKPTALARTTARSLALRAMGPLPTFANRRRIAITAAILVSLILSLAITSTGSSAKSSTSTPGTLPAPAMPPPASTPPSRPSSPPPAGRHRHAPTRLWYRLSATYSGRTGFVAKRNAPLFGDASCQHGDLENGGGQTARWDAGSDGSVLVRLIPGGSGRFEILHGRMSGEIVFAAEDNDFTYQAGRCGPGSPETVTCVSGWYSGLDHRGPRDFTLLLPGSFIASGGSSVQDGTFLMGEARAFYTPRLSPANPLCGPQPHAPPTTNFLPYLPLFPDIGRVYVYGGGTAPLDEPELHFSQRGGERFGAARVVLRSGLSFHLSTARTWTFLPDGDPEPATVTTAADEMLTVTLTRCPGTAPC